MLIITINYNLNNKFSVDISGTHSSPFVKILLIKSIMTFVSSGESAPKQGGKIKKKTLDVHNIIKQSEIILDMFVHIKYFVSFFKQKIKSYLNIRKYYTNNFLNKKKYDKCE